MLVRCPACKKSFESERSSAMPFCSERCRTIDLGHWLGESYSLTVEPEDASDAPEEQPPPSS